MHIDEADENNKGERTFGIVTPTGYVVVTESLDDESLRSVVITGSATESEHEEARGLVKARLEAEEDARFNRCRSCGSQIVNDKYTCPPWCEGE